MSATAAIDDVYPVAGWHAELPPGTVFGSVYAVEEADRLAAAAALTAAGIPIHADLIIARATLPGDEAPRAEHRGVAPGLLGEIRALYPSARIDVHVIVDADAPSGDASRLVREAVALAAAAGAERVTLPVEHRCAGDAAVREFRESGGEVWTQLVPGGETGKIEVGESEGVLVMLIEPGTRDAADPSLLDQMAQFPPRTPFGVDGGVSREIAETALARGARHVVAGRSLLGRDLQGR
ncbi:hypothetical protein JD276_00145 [Leucobacter sp. CSA1]|uniref:Uncharacterized protein n=1 Tax=Leucobacter chromiisoli TaxID=2796471 RepID=A0A934Q4Z5_9MICO|nr:hypothetical protein [Leucobacter chromiisoli]MBK0417448.1 hypothetical protein [Leucobacter chromiisoli]